jgi:hypothetical protein
MNNEIRYATLERRPVRFNDREAWWVINGSWVPMPLVEAHHNAGLLSQGEYGELFKDLPQLPSTAFSASE